MGKTLKIMLLTLLAACMVGGFTLQPVAANNAAGVQDAIDDSGGTGGADFNTLIVNVVSILSYIVGIAAVVMLIFGGFSYITSQGDSGKLTTARNTIIYALVGLVIVLFTQLIIRFVIVAATKAK